MDIIKLLGKGAFSKVYLIKENDSFFALKDIEIKTDRRRDATLREIKILQSLSKLENSHRYIVRYVSHSVKENNIEIVNEFVDGSDLRKFIADSELNPIIDIAYQLLRGLKFIHDNEIVHRDIKLENILYDRGIFKYIDFGLSCETYNETCIEKKGGTPNYLPPEFEANSRFFDRKAGDIWSLGVVLYFCHEEQLPFHGRGYKELMSDVKNKNIKLKGPIGIIINKMLTKDVFSRPNIDSLLILFREFFQPNFTKDELISLGASSGYLWDMFDQISYSLYRSDINKIKIVETK